MKNDSKELEVENIVCSDRKYIYTDVDAILLSLKCTKIALWSLDAKRPKNRQIQNDHPSSFFNAFQGKKRFLESDPPN